MKRFLSILIVFLLLAFAVSSHAITLTFSWSQEIPAENDLAGWRIYQSSMPGGQGYTKIKDIPFTAPAAEYQTTYDLYVPGTVGGEKTFYFVLTSVDTSQNESGYSNEVAFTIADVIAPKPPFIIRIIGQ